MLIPTRRDVYGWVRCRRPASVLIFKYIHTYSWRFGTLDCEYDAVVLYSGHIYAKKEREKERKKQQKGAKRKGCRGLGGHIIRK